MTDHKIIVTHVDPPFPNGKHAVAYSDNFGADDSPYGSGPDAASAIEDLMWQLEELEDA